MLYVLQFLYAVCMFSYYIFKDLVQRQFLISRLVRENDRNVWNFNIKAIKRHIFDIMEFPQFENGTKFDKPVLFVRGEMSNYIT